MEFDKDKFLVLHTVRGVAQLTYLLDALDPLRIGVDYVVAGGYARYCVSPKANPFEAADVDIFPMNSSATVDVVKKLAVELKMKIRRENAVSVTFEKYWDDLPAVQVIKPLNQGRVVTFGSVEQIIDNFDFSVGRAALFDASQALVDIDFVHDENENLLRLKNITCPVGAIIRSMKYAKKGYFMRTLEAFKIFADWDARDADYKRRIFELFTRMDAGGATPADIDELELLLFAGEEAKEGTANPWRTPVLVDDPHNDPISRTIRQLSEKEDDSDGIPF